MNRLRPAAIASLLVAVAVLLSGCVAIKSETASQRAPGVVTLNLQLCVNDKDQTKYSDCIPPNNTAENDGGFDPIQTPSLPNTNGQLLVGFRIPTGTKAPATFQSVDGRLTFTLSPGYASALTAKYQPVAGFEWVGYLSTALEFDSTNVNNFKISMTPEFVLPSGPGGVPFVSPFRWRPVVGTRPISDSTPANSPVDCPLNSLTCFDSPPPSSSDGRATIAHLATTLPVSDYSVRPPDAATVAPGQTATLTYKLSDQDAANRGAPTITLKSSTTVPGAQAQLVGASTIAIPRNGDATATVTVAVPPGTPVGSYDVVLNAGSNSVSPGAEIVKSGTAKLTVVDQSAPSIRVSSPGDTTYQVGQSVTADYACSDETGGSGIASCSAPLAPGAPIDTSTPGTFGFTVTGTDNAGNTASVTRTYTVSAPPKLVVAATPPGRVNVTLSFLFPSAAASTKFTLLQVKGVPSGSTVTATCKGGGCPTKKVKGKKQGVVFTKKNASGTVNLTPFRNKALRAGATLTVTVTKPGSFGMVKKLTVKKNKKPVLSTTCLQPNSTTAKASCVS